MMYVTTFPLASRRLRAPGAHKAHISRYPALSGSHRSSSFPSADGLRGVSDRR